MRSLPSAGPLSKGTLTFDTTRIPAKLSPGSVNAVKGLVPLPQVSSRTTTTSEVSIEGLWFRQWKTAAKPVRSAATAGRTGGRWSSQPVRLSIRIEFHEKPPLVVTSTVDVAGAEVKSLLPT